MQGAPGGREEPMVRGSGRPWALLEPATQLRATRPHPVVTSWLLATPSKASERDRTATGSLPFCVQCPPRPRPPQGRWLAGALYSAPFLPSRSLGLAFFARERERGVPAS